MQRVLYTTAAIATIVMATPLQGAEWLTDLEAAKAKAKKEGKAILVDFTGSDWCGWCVRLRSTILDTPAFQEYAKDKFVLLEVDIPKNVNKIGAALHTRNRELAARYGISSYPTILVLDADGTVLGGFIGGRDDIQYVIAPLNQALTNQAKTAAARKLDGEARATALMAVYTSLHPDLKPYFRNLRDEIALYDPNNTTGIHTEIRETELIEHLKQQITAAGSNRDQVLQQFEAALAEATPQCADTIRGMRMRYLEQSLNNLVMQAQSEEDVLEIKAIMLLMAEFSDAADAEALHREIESMFSDPAAVLKDLKIKQQSK